MSDDRYQPQADLVPQARLAQEAVTVVGVGAIGRQVALQLASIGVRQLVLIDFDVVDRTNVTTQGYAYRDLGQLKVAAVRQAVREIDPEIEVTAIADRFRGKHPVGTSLFVAVDAIATRDAVWRQAGGRVRFLTDGRMLGDVVRVVTVADFQGREHYPTTLFPAAEAERGRCTSRSTIYAASVAAGLMLHQFARWLRGVPPDSDLVLNLAASELTVPGDLRQECRTEPGV